MYVQTQLSFLDMVIMKRKKEMSKKRKKEMPNRPCDVNHKG